MRDIDKIIIHATDTPPSLDVTVGMIDEWHKAKGWSGCGYHFLIDRFGLTHIGRPIDRAGAHTKGHNKHSIGIAIAGGFKGKFDFASRQISELQYLVCDLTLKYNIHGIFGHNDFDDGKKCPCFDVKAFFMLD